MTARKRALPYGWYPASAADCERDISDFLRGFTPPEGAWLGGVAPHAGWYFSGRAAARVIRTLAASAKPDRVVLYGGHLPAHGDPVIYTEDSWETPMGPQAMDRAFAEDLASRGDALRASPGFDDNTVEVLLPFVKHFFPTTPIVAVHAPSSTRAVRLAEAVYSRLQEKGLSAVYIGSADLTHYGPNYGFSPKGTGEEAVRWVKEVNDRSLIDKALAMDVQGLLDDASFRHNTCSAGPIASVLASVAGYGSKRGSLIEYYTSYDVMPNSSFVGYAGMVF
ncbi:MAG: AmmeMemoRadiSam system protein B [Desulfomonilaceae bacterium]|nr:AmmeMemoRadiSam system protein B [Desulfomonilaceae bacterium]